MLFCPDWDHSDEEIGNEALHDVEIHNMSLFQSEWVHNATGTNSDVEICVTDLARMGSQRHIYTDSDAQTFNVS